MEKILIIDNSPLDLRILKDILKDSYEIVSSSNGIDGMDKAEAHLPALILLDIMMPSANGFAVLDALKSRSETEDIPVIIMSGSSNPAAEEKGIMLGAVDYFTKPFVPGVVRARVRTHVEMFSIRKALEELALVDSLTRVPNRRSFDQRMDIEWAHAQRSRVALSLAILDIDYFKEYNDYYGHLKGDDALKLVALETQHSLTRRTDFFARYGGEEFVLVLPDTLAEGGVLVAEQIRLVIEGLKIPHAGSLASDVLTVSIGGATIVPELEDRQEIFFENADKMLYKAKNNGRNITCWT